MVVVVAVIVFVNHGVQQFELLDTEREVDLEIGVPENDVVLGQALLEQAGMIDVCQRLVLVIFILSKY